MFEKLLKPYYCYTLETKIFEELSLFFNHDKNDFWKVSIKIDFSEKFQYIYLVSLKALFNNYV